MKTITHFITAGLLTLLSGCNALWVAGLEAQRRTRSVETLPNTATVLESCQVNKPCDRTFNLQLDNWATDPWLRFDPEKLPPGLVLSVQPVPNQPDTYTITTEGTPTKSGSYSFRANLECCMTMSGPAYQARTEPITLTITQ